MTRILIKELIWVERGNVRHLQKHNVKKDEVEEAGRNLIYHRQVKRKLFLAVGRSSERLLTIILVWKQTGKYYVASARDASKKERRDAYEKENK
ncbi:MAG: hypothetical protein HW400_242 [Candidatus Levybacteria bacterium]|nr:hypothetical protein [Candidatus Levybacteria bacterium]